MFIDTVVGDLGGCTLRDRRSGWLVWAVPTFRLNGRHVFAATDNKLLNVEVHGESYTATASTDINNLLAYFHGTPSTHPPRAAYIIRPSLGTINVNRGGRQSLRTTYSYRSSMGLPFPRSAISGPGPKSVSPFPPTRRTFWVQALKLKPETQGHNLKMFENDEWPYILLNFGIVQGDHGPDSCRGLSVPGLCHKACVEISQLLDDYSAPSDISFIAIELRTKLKGGLGQATLIDIHGKGKGSPIN
ncbi:hypothetical protein BKA70DRAFT_1406265 [Coprinopsis sp. MPI-PUGE-AT-0042]|nr:hypothetical protein BKA70DRAFT_1406265 [Coprinopsis sp. MPI-PUGE-AT-0042]